MISLTERFTDPIWALSWHDFTRRYRTRWALRHSYTSGEYSGGSLRELIAFTFDPEPSKDEIDDIIDQRTIRWTLRRSTPQLFTMSCLMWSGLPRLHGKFHLSACSEIGGFLAVATDAYLENRIGARTLRAALNLHSVEDVESYLTLTRQERSDLKSAFLFDELNRTLYSWQGDTNLAGERRQLPRRRRYATLHRLRRASMERQLAGTASAGSSDES